MITQKELQEARDRLAERMGIAEMDVMYATMFDLVWNRALDLGVEIGKAKAYFCASEFYDPGFYAYGDGDEQERWDNEGIKAEANARRLMGAK